jgi:protein tyrosine/serine phosphatase
LRKKVKLCVYPNPFRAPAAALLVALLVSTPVLAGSTAADRLASITIANFAQVSDIYYRGSQPTGDDFADLKALGVKTIIDLTDEDDKGMDARQAGLRFVQIPMSSTSAPSAAQVEQFLSIVNDPAHQPVYVHCKGGRHRTGTLTAVYRMANEGWPPDRAYEEMLKYDFDYGFGHGGQKKFVYAYGNELTRKTAATAAKATTQQ